MDPLRIVVAHNRYKLRGGEDGVFEAEVAMLKGAGHLVTTYDVHNRQVEDISRLELLQNTFWSRKSYRDIFALVKEHRADIVHFHNTLPLISPAGYYAARRAGAATVQTLHNFRVTCVNGLLFRDGHVCEACVGRSFAWPGVMHSCYRESRTASAIVAAMIWYHRKRKTWATQVDQYIALTAFAKAKYTQAGLPADKISIKPNFVDPDPGVGSHKGGYALFVGRLSHEKGIQRLLTAWAIVPDSLQLKIIGGGPMEDVVADAARRRPNIEWLGQKGPAEVQEAMKAAKVLIMPSQCYEGFPLSVTEAFACALPVVVPDHGGMGVIVKPGENGYKFIPSSSQNLAEVVQSAMKDEEALEAIQKRCRSDFIEEYSAPSNIRQMEAVYQRALAERRKER